MPRLHVIAALFLMTTGCGGHATPDGGSPTDSGTRDSASADSAAPDAGITCEPACAATEECCPDSSGVGRCIDPRLDVENCGGCGRSCLGGQGTACALGACVCGRVDFGCGGTDESICCPPGPTRTRPYCANLRTDGDDCGACGAGCDPARANLCAEAVCVCGDARGACSGAPESRCCVDELGFAGCTDITSALGHCGACGHRCGIGEVCLAGVCSVGTEACGAGCGDGEICCRGSCCARVLCDRGACGTDAGAADSGTVDAGAADAG